LAPSFLSWTPVWHPGRPQYTPKRLHCDRILAQRQRHPPREAGSAASGVQQDAQLHPPIRFCAYGAPPHA